jgi:HK97 family phage portal protein
VLGTEYATRSHLSVYRNNIWANVAVNLRSRGIAKTPLKAYRDGDKERLAGRGKTPHALARLIERPWEGGTRFRLLNKIALEYLINEPAVAYVWMDTPVASEPPQRLIPMQCSQVRARYRKDGKIGFYEWRETPSAEPTRILPEHIMEIAFEDRVSPITALTRGLAIDEAAQTSTAAFYGNGAQIGPVITTDRPVDDETVEDIEEQLRTDHKGPTNAFRAIVLANMPGVQFHQPGTTSTDAQTVEHRKMAREETLAGYHVPQPVGGVLDRATFSNIETQTRMWVVDSLGEDYAMIESAFNGQLIPRVKEWDDEGCYVEFDTGEILRGTPTQRADTYGKWLLAATRTPNELRRLENLPAIADPLADCLYVPLNAQPVGVDDPDFENGLVRRGPESKPAPNAPTETS